MSKQGQELYRKLTATLQKAADFNNAAAVLGWDQEVYMPVNGAEFRARQLSTLASQAHELVTNKEFGAVVHELAGIGGLSVEEEANVKLALEDYEKNRKLPSTFVEELSMQTSTCFNAWIDARQKNDFSLFEPSLSKMISIKQRQADLYGYEKHPYDALLDDYEKGASVAMLEPVFAKIRHDLPPILAKINASTQVDDSCFRQNFPKETQWNFSIKVLQKMGFNFDSGRQDYAEHPFTTSFSPQDVRVTTRADENNFAYMLWSTIHEGGHALYEQGLPESQYGMPLGSAASLGIHESQSRLWENCVGRGFDFWQYFYPELQKFFPTALKNVSVDTFYKAMNKVTPSLIRTEADELTYHFHVMIRYEIEKSLLENKLSPKDIKEAWNSKYQNYLGITPPNDTKGILQDVHWSHGSFGYFPTYSLGSFYAAQFYRQALKEIPDLKLQIATGNFQPLLLWLRGKVHRFGRQFTSEELCTHITGEPLNIEYFMEYVTNKYTTVYG